MIAKAIGYSSPEYVKSGSRYSCTRVVVNVVSLYSPSTIAYCTMNANVTMLASKLMQVPAVDWYIWFWSS